MIDINTWAQEFIKALTETFNDRVWFAGLQGSYARGEQTENSDIDTVVILDNASFSDIKTFNAMLDTLPNRELTCGFLSGKNELLNWEPSDLFQFYYDTKPIIGNLDGLLSLINEESIDRAVKIGAGNIYHGCVHNVVYDKSEEILKGLYKAASFVVQAICFRETGKYISRQKDLLEAASDADKVIIDTFLRFKKGDYVDFEKASEIIFEWSKKLL